MDSKIKELSTEEKRAVLQADDPEYAGFSCMSNRVVEFIWFKLQQCNGNYDMLAESL